MATDGLRSCVRRALRHGVPLSALVRQPVLVVVGNGIRAGGAERVLRWLTENGMACDLLPRALTCRRHQGSLVTPEQKVLAKVVGTGFM